MATKFVWNSDKYKETLMKSLVEEQTRRLVEYAKQTTQEIGDTIQQYHSKHHMNRTGNLLDSLSWCVAYRGNVVASGYYQNRATQLSYLHEFDENFEAYPVGGHTLAEKYIQQYGGILTDGWRLFFTIRAPYWGYWEHGFTMKRKGKPIGFRKYSVMTQFFPKVEKDLSPAKVEFRNKVPDYVKSYTIRGTSGRISGTTQRKYDRYSKGKYDPYSKYPNKRYKYK